MAKSRERLGAASALCTFLLLACVAWMAGASGMVFNELGLFLAGRFREVASNHTTFLMMFPVILAVVVLELPCAFAAAIWSEVVLGKKSGKHALTELLESLQDGHHFYSFFVAVCLEELFARWFFLGVLASLFSSTVAFYVLFVIGNGLWALIHLGNYHAKKDRRVLRVLPQFVAGIFFTYVFVKYGLLAVVLTHFASNAVVFALHKVQAFDVVDVLIIGYAAMCAGVSYALMDRPLTDVLSWFADQPVFRLEGWGLADYIKVSVFLSSCIVALFGLLLYDRGEVGKDDVNLEIYIIGLPLIVIGLYGLYWLLGLFITDVPYRILVLSILLTFLHSGASGSAVARTFWTSLPDVYISVCILQAVGFWLALVYVMVEAIIQLPRILLVRIDD